MINTDNPQPLVTVYMPTYNRVELLQRAVESVLNQNYKNIELIVVDDNSTDGTHEYLSRMAKEDSRFKYFINENNSGACASRNKAIFAAKGEFITGLDDDDYFLNDRISTFINSWYENSYDAIALYSHSFIIQKDKKLKRVKRIKSCNHRELLCHNWIGNQLFTKTAYLKKIKGFDPSLPAWQDIECWYRLLKDFKAEAYVLPNYTYVIDQSHPHERISLHKKELILSSYHYICNKHDLKRREKNILSLQLTPYVPYPPKFSAITSSLVYMPRLYNLINTFHQSRSMAKRKLIESINK